MSEPFIGEIRLFSFNYAPRYWALCNGQLLPINQNQALFTLLGTMYGGNGQTTFALPDLRARVPIHRGNGHTIGEQGGTPAHTLSIPELPTHTHTLQASDTPATTNEPGMDRSLANAAGSNAYGPATQLVPMAQAAVANTGGSQAHQNMQPFLTLTFCIALQGIFPSQN